MLPVKAPQKIDESFVQVIMIGSKAFGREHFLDTLGGLVKRCKVKTCVMTHASWHQFMFLPFGHPTQIGASIW